MGKAEDLDTQRGIKSIKSGKPLGEKKTTFLSASLH
jgi:hypothetical protein